MSENLKWDAPSSPLKEKLVEVLKKTKLLIEEQKKVEQEKINRLERMGRNMVRQKVKEQSDNG